MIIYSQINAIARALKGGEKDNPVINSGGSVIAERAPSPRLKPTNLYSEPTVQDEIIVTGQRSKKYGLALMVAGLVYIAMSFR